jgi:hypothetical protein
MSHRSHPSPLASLAGVAGCGVAITLLLGSQARVPDLLATSPRYLVAAHGYLAAFGVSFLLYLLALRLVRAASSHPRALMAIIGGGAVVMRLALLPAPPTLTTDHFRYRWDGRVARHGVNPYRYPPDEPSLRPLRFPGWERINYPGTRTPYPPLAELTFWLNAAFLGDTILGLKLLFTAFDLATACLLLHLLHALRRPPSDVLVYAWHPLVVTETALSGHQDALGIFFLVAALWFAARGEFTAEAQNTRRTTRLLSILSGTALGLSAAAKSFTVLYLPAMARRRGWLLVAAACVVIAAFHVPILLTGAPLQGGAQAMAVSWQANSSLYLVVRRLAAAVLPGAPDAAQLIARGLLGLLVLAVALTRGRGTPSTRDERPAASFASLARDLYVVTMVMLLASPVVMPWYLVWIVPLLLFYPASSGFAFSALVTLAYLQPVGRWYWWLSWVEYLPVCLLLAVDLLRDRPHASEPCAS